jgi:hypothetical protein
MRQDCYYARNFIAITTRKGENNIDRYDIHALTFG